MMLGNDAQKHISELNGVLRETKNPQLFLSPFYLHEAISSSKIENIHTTIDSVLEDEVVGREKSQGNKEVKNYSKAVMATLDFLEKYGLSSRTIKAIHQHLEVRKGVAGEFRRVQNALATRRSDGTHETHYTPPSIAQLNGLLSNWETFVQRDKTFLPLVKVAISHYQFEAIHPFEDGNGRTGRILMVLQLVFEKMLDYPLLFISGYLSAHKDKYKDALLNVTRHGQWWEYIKFMLKGFSLQANQTMESLKKIKKAKKTLKDRLYGGNPLVINKSNIDSIVEHIFHHPLTHPKHMGRETDVHWQTCSKYLAAMARMGILRYYKASRYKIYENTAALDSLRPG